MKVLFDTNVVLDLLLDRKPFSTAARRLVGRVERREIEGFLGATTVTTIHYLLTKALDTERARDAIRDLLGLFSVAPVDTDVLTRALSLPLRDYEDAVLHEAARQSRSTIILTRDDDFVGIGLSIETPLELEARLALAEHS